MTTGEWCPKCEHQVWGICDKTLECENFVRKNRPLGASKEKAMTTTIKVHVNGKYRATVRQEGRDPVTVEGNYNGGSGEKSFSLPHPAKAAFYISEERVADGDEREA
jgi:hypothetical protein